MANFIEEFYYGNLDPQVQKLFLLSVQEILPSQSTKSFPPLIKYFLVALKFL